MHPFAEGLIVAESSTWEAASPDLPDADTVAERIAAAQHGVVTMAQLREAGFSSRMVRLRVRKGRFAPLHRGVYRVGIGHFPWQGEMAAVLACGPGALLSHRSAAVLWGLLPPHPGDRFRPQVTVPGSRRGLHLPGIVTHRTSQLPAEDRGVREGIPLTAPARTLIDLAGLAARRVSRPVRGPRPGVAQRIPCAEARSGSIDARYVNREPRSGRIGPRPGTGSNRPPPLSAPEVEQAVARAERDGLVTLPGLRRRLASSGGRPGLPLLKGILELEGGPAFTRSEAERVLLDWIRRVDLPRPDVNARVGPYEVDFLWRTAGLAVEVDGYAFHASRESFEADRVRDAELAAAGIQVLRVTWRQLRDRPEAVLVRLARALEQARGRARRRTRRLSPP